MVDKVAFLNKNQIPFHKTEPLHVVFKLTAGLGDIAAGFYDWTLQRGFPLVGPPDPQMQPFPASPRVDLDPQNMYAVDYFTFSADIEPADYTASMDSGSQPLGGVAGVPRFTLMVESERGAPIIKQPIPLPQYYQNAPFPKWKKYLAEADEVGGEVTGGVQIMDIGFMGIKSTNQLEGTFEARLQQTAALVGKQNITLVMALGMLEIRDEAFISQYMAAHKDVYK